MDFIEIECFDFVCVVFGVMEGFEVGSRVKEVVVVVEVNYIKDEMVYEMVCVCFVDRFI